MVLFKNYQIIKQFMNKVNSQPLCCLCFSSGSTFRHNGFEDVGKNYLVKEL